MQLVAVVIMNNAPSERLTKICAPDAEEQEKPTNALNFSSPVKHITLLDVLFSTTPVNVDG